MMSTSYVMPAMFDSTNDSMSGKPRRTVARECEELFEHALIAGLHIGGAGLLFNGSSKAV